MCKVRLRFVGRLEKLQLAPIPNVHQAILKDNPPANLVPPISRKWEVAARFPKSPKLSSGQSMKLGCFWKLLVTTRHQKLYKIQDWESVRTKYEDIAERLHAVYPKEGKLEEYPHTADPSVITKDRILSKIKRIKIITI